LKIWIRATIRGTVSGQSSELSLQLYSLKEEALADPVAMLGMVSALGYQAVETAGDYEIGVVEWREHLKTNGLRLSGAHLLMERLESELPELAAFNAELGNFHLIVPVPPDGEGMDRYHSCAERLNAVGQAARAHGCHLSYHNHHWEFEALEGGRLGIEILLEETDPALVGFQVDTAWALAGGGDVLGFLRRHRSRVSGLHAKEYRIASKDEPEMGEGDVPFADIVSMALEDGWQLTVEHEPGEGAVEGVRTSARYLTRLIGELAR
jgi:sugar phosphate isomerase/epimerase